MLTQISILWPISIVRGMYIERSIFSTLYVMKKIDNIEKENNSMFSQLALAQEIGLFHSAEVIGRIE